MHNYFQTSPHTQSRCGAIYKQGGKQKNVLWLENIENKSYYQIQLMYADSFKQTALYLTSLREELTDQIISSKCQTQSGYSSKFTKTDSQPSWLQTVIKSR